MAVELVAASLFQLLDYNVECLGLPELLDVHFPHFVHVGLVLPHPLPLLQLELLSVFAEQLSKVLYLLAVFDQLTDQLEFRVLLPTFQVLPPLVLVFIAVDFPYTR